MLEESGPEAFAGKRWDWPGLAAEKEAWPWLRPGIRIKVLWEDGQGESAALLAYEPGAEAPLHEHMGEEQILVLQGIQEDASGSFGPGSYLVNPVGTRHIVKSPGGCLVWIHWRRPVRFLQPDSPAENPAGSLEEQRWRNT
jgi:anti-sigma factor ChrR (cupin superfamily)